MKLILPIGAMLCTAVTTLTALVFCMAMGANASAAEIGRLKLWMAALALVGAGGVVLAIFLIRAGHPGWAAGAAFAPTVIFAVLLLVALIK